MSLTIKKASSTQAGSLHAENTGPRSSLSDCDPQANTTDKESSINTEVKRDISNMRTMNSVSEIDKNIQASKKIAQNTEYGVKSHSNNYKNIDTNETEGEQNFPAQNSKKKTIHSTDVCRDSEEHHLASRQHPSLQGCQNVWNSEDCLKIVPVRMQNSELLINSSLSKCKCTLYCSHKPSTDVKNHSSDNSVLEVHPKHSCCYNENTAKLAENSKLQEGLSMEEVDTVVSISDGIHNDNDVDISACNEKLSDKKLKVLAEQRYVTASKNMKKGERYLPSFKSRVIMYAADNTVKAAAEKYKVHRGTVAQWLKEKKKTIDGKNRRNRKGKQSQETKFAENSFLVWLNMCIELNQNLSKDNIASKICELLKHCTIDSKCRQSSWLLAYSDRFSKQAKIGKQLCKNKRLTYPEEFKMQVIKFAQMHSQRKAGCVFAVSRKRVYEWLLQVQSKGPLGKKERNPLAYVLDSKIEQQIWEWYKLQKNIPTGKQIREIGRHFYRTGGYSNMKCSYSWYYKWRERVGLPPISSDIMSQDSLLLEWILTQFDNNKTLSHHDVLDEALRIQCCGNSKGSLGWTLRFCKKYSYLLQDIPEVTTCLPSIMEAKVENYRKELWRTVQENKVSLEHIIAMDEIPLNFSCTDKKSLLRQSGFRRCQGTVMLASLANGTLLPALLVLKDGGDRIIENQENSILLTAYSQDGCVNPTVMLVWMQFVLLQYLKGDSILINDIYQPHLDSEVAEKLCEHRIKQLTIPGGCTSRLQPLNSIVQKLQNSVQEEWKIVLRANSFSSHLKSPCFQQVYEWVSKSLLALAHTEKANLKNCFEEMRLIP